jgi:hypothetical protein
MIAAIDYKALAIRPTIKNLTVNIPFQRKGAYLLVIEEK